MELGKLSDVLGGHPLSLKLAARQLRRNFQPDKLTRLIAKFRAGINDGADFGDLDLAMGDNKIDSVSVTLAQTLNALSDKRCEQFRALGVLPVDLSFCAAHIFAIWSVWGNEDHDGIDDLVVEGLIEPVEGRTDQYTQHRLLHAYARALLRQEVSFEATRDRHWNYLISLAYKVFTQQPETWKQLDDTLDQIHVLGNELVQLMPESIPKGMTDRLLDAGLNFANAVTRYVFGHYVGEEGRRWLMMGLVCAETKNNQERVGLFASQLGYWHNQRGETQTALDYHRHALAAATMLNDKLSQVSILSHIGSVYIDLGENVKALNYINQVLPEVIEMGDRGGQAAILNNIGAAYRALGENSKALDYFNQTFHLYGEMGDRGGQVAALSNIGTIYYTLRETSKALHYSEQALRLYRLEGDKSGQAITLSNIAGIYKVLGDYHKAFDYFEQGLPLLIEVGDIYLESTIRDNMALILWYQGKHQVACEHMRKAQALNKRIGISTANQDEALVEWGCPEC